jgi:hypothetical protein
VARPCARPSDDTDSRSGRHAPRLPLERDPGLIRRRRWRRVLGRSAEREVRAHEHHRDELRQSRRQRPDGGPGLLAATGSDVELEHDVTLHDRLAEQPSSATSSTPSRRDSVTWMNPSSISECGF